MRKKNKNILIVLAIILTMFLVKTKTVEAYDYSQSCTKEAAIELAKIVFHEQAYSYKNDEDSAFFIQISTGAVVINNANRTSKSTGATSSDWKDKIYGLIDKCYNKHSTYRDDPIESIPKNIRGKMLYIAELVLTGKYTFPTNMTIQGSPDEPDKVRQYATEKDGWHIFTGTGGLDTMIAYEVGLSATGKDQFGNVLSDTSFGYYKSLAKSYMKSDYSAYTPDTVCTGLSSSGNGSTNNDIGNSGSENATPPADETNNQTGKYTGSLVGVCANPGILRVIYFCLIIIDIIKVIIPIALIIFGLIDFSKSVVISDEKVQKKTVNLFVKRIISAVLVFAVPWIVEVVMVSLGNLTEKVNFTDCIENANSEKIKELEKNESLLKKTQESCILNGKAFLIRYYDKDNKKILETSAHCTGIPFKYKEISAAGFKGWTFKDKSDGTQIFRNGGMVNKDFYDKYINDYGSLDLVQVFE